jgi:hypothetical protein
MFTKGIPKKFRPVIGEILKSTSQPPEQTEKVIKRFLPTTPDKHEREQTKDPE